MGLDFFKKVIEIQNKYKRPFQKVENDLQTNGILLNDEWCKFLRDSNFLVGLSIEDPKELHNKYRLAKGGQPTFEKVVNAADLLKKYNVPFNALCVVNDENSLQPLATYRFLRDEIAPRVIQFIPGVEPIDFKFNAPNDNEKVTAWSVAPVA